MNYYAYPLIFDAMKSSGEKYLSIQFCDNKVIYIYRKNKVIYLKDNNKVIIYNFNNFNFFANIPIERITIIFDKYGTRFTDIFNKNRFKAAIKIQQSWRKFKLN